MSPDRPAANPSCSSFSSTRRSASLPSSASHRTGTRLHGGGDEAGRGQEDPAQELRQRPPRRPHRHGPRGRRRARVREARDRRRHRDHRLRPRAVRPLPRQSSCAQPHASPEECEESGSRPEIASSAWRSRIPKITCLSSASSATASGRRVEEYPLHGRGGQGVRTFKTNPKTGELIAARVVDPSHELMLISEGGIVLRTPVEHISLQLRSTQGVTIHDVEGDRVAAVAVIDMDREYEAPADALPTGATVAGDSSHWNPRSKASARDSEPEAFGKSAAGRRPRPKALRQDAGAGQTEREGLHQTHGRCEGKPKAPPSPNPQPRSRLLAARANKAAWARSPIACVNST